MPRWQDRLRDAQRFLDVAQAANGPEYTNQAASNAILAMIAGNDAICLYLGSRQPVGESHTEAARMLQEVCRGTRWEQAAAQRSRQLLDLLRQKNAAQYHGRPLTRENVDRIMRQVERFVEWAEEVVG
jgi:hypothetical protein